MKILILSIIQYKLTIIDPNPTIHLEKTKSKSFLDVLFNVLEECTNQMTDKDIREEVDTFLFEGHDTSSVSMSLTILLLGIHQDIQVRFVLSLNMN